MNKSLSKIVFFFHSKSHSIISEVNHQIRNGLFNTPTKLPEFSTDLYKTYIYLYIPRVYIVWRILSATLRQRQR